MVAESLQQAERVLTRCARGKSWAIFRDDQSNALEARLTVSNQTLEAVATQLLQAQRNAPGVLRRLMAASVLLVKALGGGWDRSSLPAF